MYQDDMGQWQMSFYNDLLKFARKTDQKMENVTVSVIFQLNESIIMRTPVDLGQARGGWIPSLNSVKRDSGIKDKSGNSTLTKANLKAKDAPGNVYYLVNNVDHIRPLEYGMYPNPPKVSTGKTSGGYSTLAPQGMVRVSVKQFKSSLRKAVNEYK